MARTVKAELPERTVLYFDEAAAERHPGGPRELFEYEMADQTGACDGGVVLAD